MPITMRCGGGEGNISRFVRVWSLLSQSVQKTLMKEASAVFEGRRKTSSTA